MNRAVKNSSSWPLGSCHPTKGKKRSDSNTSTTRADPASDEDEDEDDGSDRVDSLASIATGRSDASVAGARSLASRRSTTTADARAGPTPIAAAAAAPNERAPAGAQGPFGPSPMKTPPPIVSVSVSGRVSVSSSTRAPALVSHRISLGFGTDDAFPAAATHPAPAATPVRYTASSVFPSFSPAPRDDHSGAGAGAESRARSARTHATRRGSGGVRSEDVITDPTATNPGGGITRHAANVPFGFLRRRDPESDHTSSNPAAGAVASKVASVSPPGPGRPGRPASARSSSSQGARATSASGGALNDGTTTDPSAANPGGHTGVHADMSVVAPVFRDHHASSRRCTRKSRSASDASGPESTRTTPAPFPAPLFLVSFSAPIPPTRLAGVSSSPSTSFARSFARTIISPTRFADFRSSTNVGRSSSNHSPRSDGNHPRA